MKDYVLKEGSASTPDIDAAIQLIGSRAVHGYWRTVFKHFQESKDNPYAEMNLLKILTKLLALSGERNWRIDHLEAGRGSAISLWFALPDDVVDAVIARAKVAPANQFDAYVIAIVSAHDPGAKKFLLDVLTEHEATKKRLFAGTLDDGQTMPRYPSNDALFGAAVGLANLGERAGVAWLIESPSSDTPNLSKRIDVLATLTGLKYEKFEDWQAWWKTNPLGDSFEPKSRVILRCP